MVIVIEIVDVVIVMVIVVVLVIVLVIVTVIVLVLVLILMIVTPHHRVLQKASTYQGPPVRCSTSSRKKFCTGWVKPGMCARGHPPKYATKAAALSVALMSTRRKSGR